MVKKQKQKKLTSLKKKFKKTTLDTNCFLLKFQLHLILNDHSFNFKFNVNLAISMVIELCLHTFITSNNCPKIVSNDLKLKFYFYNFELFTFFTSCKTM